MSSTSARPSTWGTTATLTSRGILAVLSLALVGVVTLTTLALLGAPDGYASAVAAIVSAGLAALGLGSAVGAGAHAAQYVRSGSPTAAGSAGPVSPWAADPADRPHGQPAEVD